MAINQNSGTFGAIQMPIFNKPQQFGGGVRTKPQPDIGDIQQQPNISDIQQQPLGSVPQTSPQVDPNIFQSPQQGGGGVPKQVNPMPEMVRQQPMTTNLPNGMSEQSDSGMLNNKAYGFSVRNQPMGSEADYFNKDPYGMTRPAMMGIGNNIVTNPNMWNGMDKPQQNAMLGKYGSLLHMRSMGDIPNFNLETYQKENFQGTPYANDETAMKQQLVGRMIGGDPIPQGYNYTDPQKNYAEQVLRQMSTRR